MAEELASLDGVIAPSAETTIPATDEGFLRGDGVFEVIRVYDGVPFALQDHLTRLGRSTTNLRLGWRVPKDELGKDIERLLEARGGSSFDGCLRVVLTRGGRRLVMTEPLPPTPEHARLAYVTYAPTHLLDGVKSLSYAANMLATRIARERGADEALLVTPHGRVLEGPTTSFFYVLDGALYTPPLEDRILDSITRRALFAVTEAAERITTLDDLRTISEAFLASSAREVQPVHAIDGVSVPAAPGPVSSAAARAVAGYIEARL